MQFYSVSGFIFIVLPDGPMSYESLKMMECWLMDNQLELEENADRDECNFWGKKKM